MSVRMVPVVVAVAAVSAQACSLPGLLQKNLRAIEASTDTITRNSDVVKHSTSVSEAGIKSFEGLKAPMESMAKLDPTLKAVAALDEPMSRVAGLAPSLREVGGLGPPMTRLVGLQPSLDATAALGPSMDRLAAMRPSLDAVGALGDPMKSVAGLRTPLAAVADLKAPMDELAALRRPLERVADLREPMTRLAALGAWLDRPLLLVGLALLALGVWGLVTFLAVRLALLSASGVLRRIGPALLVVALSASAHAGAAADPLPADLGARVDSLFAKYTADTPGCAVGVSKDGTEVLARGYGAADLEHGVANTAETVFEAGSVSKQFTAAAVLLLAQAGKLKLDDPVRDYVPELPDYGSPEVTLRHLLHHTSGLRDWGTVTYAAGWPRGSRVHTHALVLDVLSRQKSLNFPPGSEYSYSNSGYNLLAIIVERVSGKTFAQYTRDAIFEPLAMSHTQWRDDYTRIVKGRAIAYARAADGFHMSMPFENVHGNGGLLTTVGDLLKWNRNFTTERVGGRGLITELQRRGRLGDGLEISYARGLVVSRYRGVPEVSHAGSTAGYRAFLTRFPDQATSVAVLCNDGSADAGDLAHGVAAIVLGRALGPEATPSPVPVDAAVLQRWAGLYRNTRTAEPLRVTVESGTLRAEGRGALVAQSDSQFAVGDGDVRVRFRGEGVGRSFDVIGADGDVTHYAVAAPFTPTAADLAKYEGTYVSDEAEVTYRIRAENGALFALRRPDARFALTPSYKDAFTNAQLPLVLFRRDPKTGQVVGMSLGLGRVRDLRFKKEN